MAEERDMEERIRDNRNGDIGGPPISTGPAPSNNVDDLGRNPDRDIMREVNDMSLDGYDRGGSLF
jgi:hypothetical protein